MKANLLNLASILQILMTFLSLKVGDQAELQADNQLATPKQLPPQLLEVSVTLKQAQVLTQLA